MNHELGHIVSGHQGVYLDNIYERNLSDEENEANQLACDWLLNSEAFAAFVADTKPYFSKAAVEKFAKSKVRHPGIVVGRLQYEDIVTYQHLRSFLVKVSPFLQNLIDKQLGGLKLKTL